MTAQTHDQQYQYSNNNLAITKRPIMLSTV